MRRWTHGVRSNFPLIDGVSVDGVSGVVVQNQSPIDALGSGFVVSVNLCSTRNNEIVVRNIVRRMVDFYSIMIPIFLGRKDDIFSAWQWPSDGFKSFSAHDDVLVERHLFEVL